MPLLDDVHPTPEPPQAYSRINGILRLFVVATTVSWFGVAAAAWYHTMQEAWMVSGHISPLTHDRGTVTATSAYWPVYSATPEYMRLDPVRREKAAIEFVDRFVRPHADRFDTDALESWIRETSHLDEVSAPIALFPSDSLRVAFRQYPPPPFMVIPRLSRVVSDAAVIKSAALASLALTPTLLLLGVAVRWVYRGFVGV